MLSRLPHLMLLSVLPWATSSTYLVGVFFMCWLAPWHVVSWAALLAAVIAFFGIDVVKVLLMRRTWPRRWWLMAGCTAGWSAWPWLAVTALLLIVSLGKRLGPHVDLAVGISALVVVGPPVLGTLLALVLWRVVPGGGLVALAHLPAQLPVLLVPLVVGNGLSMWDHVPMAHANLCVHVTCEWDWKEGDYGICDATIRQHALGSLAVFSREVATFQVGCENPQLIFRDPRLHKCHVWRAPQGAGAEQLQTVITALELEPWPSNGSGAAPSPAPRR